MTAEHDRIPIVETYRGVGIHDQQPADRIEQIVKPAIDAVLALSNPAKLVAYVEASVNPPEARLLAAARLQAIWDLAAENRELRPKVDMTYVRACIAGLGSAKWRDRRFYTSMLDGPAAQGPPGAGNGANGLVF